MSYNAKVRQLQGGAVLEVVTGGEIRLNGGTITNNGTQATAIASLTDSTTGTANDTLTDVGAAFSQSAINNNFADLGAKVNAILAALRGAGVIAT